MRLASIVHPEEIIEDLSATTKDEVLAVLAAKVHESHADLDRDELLNVLKERERLGSTGIGGGIAIPHCKLRASKELVLAFARSVQGVPFNALDNRPVHLFFLLIAPEDGASMHLKMLARISRILKDPAVRRALLEAPDATAIHAIIGEQDNRY